MKIKGIPVGTTMPRADWNQNDPKKADFIKNKPDLDELLSSLEESIEDSLTAITSIPNAEDLDRLVDPGRYACETDESAKTIQACPVDKAFTLDVRYSNGVGHYVGQELRPRDKGARLYRQFVPYSEILSDEAKKLYDRVHGLKPQGGGYNGTPDTGWYDEDNSEYFLVDAEELYGFAKLVNEGHTFEGKTVRLGADIIVNNGDASKWDGNTSGLYSWTPIGSGTTKCFSGIFDGEGHYISGLYNPGKNDNGLFGFTTNATIQNLAVINSYFGTTAYNGQFLSGAVARALGSTLKNLYSDAVLVSEQGNWYTGGIAACVKTGKVDNCVFAGVIKTTGTGKTNRYTGGITGGPDGGGFSAEITNCLFVGHIKTDESGVGGIAGMLGPGSVVDGCVSVGTIEGNAKQVGAILGWASGTGNRAITNCYYSAELGLDLYAGSDAGSVVETTGSKVLPAVCAKYSMMPTKWAKVYDSENNSSTDLLWVTASPTSAFAPQTIELDLSGYDYVAVLGAETASASPTYMPIVVAPCAVGSWGNISGTGIDPGVQDKPAWLFSRRFLLVEDGIQFFAGGQYDIKGDRVLFDVMDSGNWNIKAVPFAILGIKGVAK